MQDYRHFSLYRRCTVIAEEGDIFLNRVSAVMEAKTRKNEFIDISYFVLTWIGKESLTEDGNSSRSLLRSTLILR